MKHDEVKRLMKKYAAIIEQLRTHGISPGNVVGDYAEKLVAMVMDLNLAHTSQKGYDCVADNGDRYQVKARREGHTLGVIRNLSDVDRKFDYLVVVVFHKDFEVGIALRIPHRIVQQFAKEKKYEGGHVLTLNKQILNHPDVEDITAMFGQN